MRNRVPTLLSVFAFGTAALLLVAAAPEASAQSAGQIIFTRGEPPAKASRAQMRRFLRKHRVRVLKTTAETPDHALYVMARLRYRPKAAWLKLPQNAGKLRLAFYRRVKRRWTLANTTDVDYTPGTRVVRFPHTIKGSWGLPRHTRYQVRLTVRDPRKREKTLARTYLTFK